MPENSKAYATFLLPHIVEKLRNSTFEFGGKTYVCEDILVGDYKTIWALTDRAWVRGSKTTKFCQYCDATADEAHIFDDERFTRIKPVSYTHLTLPTN